MEGESWKVKLLTLRSSGTGLQRAFACFQPTPYLHVSHMKVTIDLTGFLAIWDAVLSTVAIVWDVYKWRTIGPNLQMRLMIGMESYNIPEYEGMTLIVAVVTNRGDRPTTITHLGLAYYDVWWKAMLRKKASANAFITIPSTTQRVPFELKPGVEWSGMIKQNKELEAWAWDGWLYVIVYHSHNRNQIGRAHV